MAKQNKPTGADTPAQIAARLAVTGVLDELKSMGKADKLEAEAAVQLHLDEIKRKGGGGKLTRSETVTVRLDPQLRYLAELAGRIHRRTLSSYIEWAITKMLEEEPIRPVWLKGSEASNHTIGSEAEYLWDVDESDRFAKLALRYPNLLTHDEQILWKLIRENGYLWLGRKHKTNGEWTWEVQEKDLIFERLREHWEKFKAVANGTSDKSVLPKWPRNMSASFDDFDNEIPF